MIDSAETLKNPRVAIMQPYFLPYLGYFQLIAAADVFVFYDDVHFIKKGWLRRNRIWSNNQEQLISLPCKGVSSNKLINEIEVATKHPDYFKIKKSIIQSYAQASEFKKLRPLLEQIFDDHQCTLAEFNARSITAILNYLDIRCELISSSEFAPETRGLQRSDRLISITKKLGSSTYINSLGGKDLYDKAYFSSKDIELQFLDPKIPVFPDGIRKGQEMNFSIIDTLMWNGVQETKQILKKYSLS